MTIFRKQSFWSLLTTVLSEGTQDDLSGALEYFVQTVINILLSPERNTNNEPVLTF